MLAWGQQGSSVPWGSIPCDMSELEASMQVGTWMLPRSFSCPSVLMEKEGEQGSGEEEGKEKTLLVV